MFFKNAYLSGGMFEKERILDLITYQIDKRRHRSFVLDPCNRVSSQNVYAAEGNPYATPAADVNGDGKPDVIVANSVSDTTVALLNIGNGTFADLVTYSIGVRPASLVTADVNGDNQIDIIVSNFNSDTVGILINTDNGTFAA